MSLCRWSCDCASRINRQSRAELPSTEEGSFPPLNPIELGFIQWAVEQSAGALFGPRPLIEDNSVQSSATTVFNLQVDYKYKHWMTQHDALNLFNSKDHDIDYFDASWLPGAPKDGVPDLHFHPIEPRLVHLYLTYNFNRGSPGCPVWPLLSRRESSQHGD